MVLYWEIRPFAPSSIPPTYRSLKKFYPDSYQSYVDQARRGNLRVLRKGLTSDLMAFDHLRPGNEARLPFWDGKGEIEYYVVWIPTNEDCSLLCRLYVGASVETPPWRKIQADLIAKKHSPRDLENLGPPAILAMLREETVLDKRDVKSPPGERQSLNLDGLHPPSEIAEKFHLNGPRDLDALEKRLARWREKNPAGGWIINSDRTRQNRAKYLYPLKEVFDLVNKLKASRETSHERPTKRKTPL